jgi:hypothetical protein
LYLPVGLFNVLSCELSWFYELCLPDCCLFRVSLLATRWRPPSKHNRHKRIPSRLVSTKCFAKCVRVAVVTHTRTPTPFCKAWARSTSLARVSSKKTSTRSAPFGNEAKPKGVSEWVFFVCLSIYLWYVLNCFEWMIVHYFVVQSH